MEISNVNKKTRFLGNTALIVSIVFLVFVILLSVSVGSAYVPITDTARIILKSITGFGKLSESAQNNAVIIIGVRLPRVLLAGLVGAALSISGTSMQGLLRNPLADSSTLGISSCAALGAVLVIATGFQPSFSPYLGVALVSILFAFLSFLLIMAFAYKVDRSLSTNTIILTGVIISMFTGSGISFIIAVCADNDKINNILFWTMGSFSGRGWDYVILMLPFVAVGTAGLLRFSGELNVFALGEEQARYFGVNVKRSKIIILILVSMLVGISVSVSGTIAFVGLVIPHISRMLVGPNHRILMPFSLTAGASFMIVTDLVSRTILGSSELPVGVMTSFIGSIIFIYIFYTQRTGKSGRRQKER